MAKKNETSWRDEYGPQNKYDAENTVRIGFKLNRKTDADILEALDNAPSKQGLVKEAIRFYLAKKNDLM